MDGQVRPDARCYRGGLDLGSCSLQRTRPTVATTKPAAGASSSFVRYTPAVLVCHISKCPHSHLVVHGCVCAEPAVWAWYTMS
jgi:hypothetical protein